MLAWLKSLFGDPAEKRKRRQSRAYQKRVREHERQLRKRQLGETNEHTSFYFKPYAAVGVVGGGGA